MLQIIVRIIAILLVLVGVIFIYDARILTKKFFGFGDQNEASQRIKNIRVYYGYDRRIHAIFYLVRIMDKLNR